MKSPATAGPGPGRPPKKPLPPRLPLLLLLLLLLHCASTTTSTSPTDSPIIEAHHRYRRYTTDDAIVLEVLPEERVVDNEMASSVEIRTRTKRQSSWTMVSSPCLTGRGTLGKCMSFRLCYPYIKLPDLQYWDSWVLGMYDTCSYINHDHKQMFGVCCPHAGIFGENHKEDGQFAPLPPLPPMAMPPNWPPPLPTHPPDHTVPPVPTHPPSPAPAPTTPKPKPPTVAPPPWSPVKPPNTDDESDEEVEFQCGIKNGPQDQERIVGGQNADPGEWPWIVAIFNAGRHFCGGSLIDDRHVLTAAHCVAHMNSWDVARLTANLGDYNIKSKSEVRHLERKIKRVVRHKGFDQRTLYNDIALLTLDKPIKFTKDVHPICLPQTRSLYSGQTATVIGWGSLRESGPQPAILQKVNVPVWSNQECKMKYGAAAPGGIVEHFLCAGKAAKDSCSGDSGGPLMMNDSSKWTQVGVVSWGIGCGKGQYPGVYTRVTSFMNWITKNLKT